MRKVKPPKCVICGKTAEHRYTEDGKLQVFVLPIEHKMALLTHTFPFCIPCSEDPASVRKLEKIMIKKSAHYWGSKMETGEIFGTSIEDIIKK